MATQTEITATLRKPAQLRKLLRLSIAEERKAEKLKDTAKTSYRETDKKLKACLHIRRSLEDELERSCSLSDEEW